MSFERAYKLWKKAELQAPKKKSDGSKQPYDRNRCRLNGVWSTGHRATSV